jgi:hypothetical protein
MVRSENIDERNFQIMEINRPHQDPGGQADAFLPVMVPHHASDPAAAWPRFFQGFGRRRIAGENSRREEASHSRTA